jgi:hypothetical protein
MSRNAMDSSPGIRTSDAERERVVSKLQREFAAGRLTMAELEQRVAAAQAARTSEQLSTVTADLPAELVPARAPAAAPDRRLICLLWCLCPPAGLVYSLLSRLAIQGEA